MCGACQLCLSCSSCLGVHRCLLQSRRHICLVIGACIAQWLVRWIYSCMSQIARLSAHTQKRTMRMQQHAVCCELLQIAVLLTVVQVCKDVIVACHALVPCGHVFCGPCISDWLQRQFNCPVCR